MGLPIDFCQLDCYYCDLLVLLFCKLSEGCTHDFIYLYVPDNYFLWLHNKCLLTHINSFKNSANNSALFSCRYYYFIYIS